MSQELTTVENKTPAVSATEQLTQENAFSPEVDVFRNEEGYTFLVDLPGVSAGQVNIEIDEKDVLSLRAKTSFEEKTEPQLRQFRVGNYFRSFQLPKEMDKDNIHTELNHGVLRIFVPVREALKPRRITINA